jgi:hypothetical protein
MAINAARVGEDFGNFRKERTRSSLLVGDIVERRRRPEIFRTSSLRENARDAANAKK